MEKFWLPIGGRAAEWDKARFFSYLGSLIGWARQSRAHPFARGEEKIETSFTLKFIQKKTVFGPSVAFFPRAIVHGLDRRFAAAPQLLDRC